MADTLPVWLRPGTDGVGLTLHVQPGAARTAVAGEHGDALKIRLAAPPIEGRANECLLAFLAERLGVPRSAIVLRSGQSSRRKIVMVAGLAAGVVSGRLLG